VDVFGMKKNKALNEKHEFGIHKVHFLDFFGFINLILLVVS